MAKGAYAKEQIFAKILETFEGSFMYNNGKELRIPFDEGDNVVQIKVALTCAKENVSPTGEKLVVKESAPAPKETGNFMNFPEPHKPVEPTEEEKKNVEDLLASLGLV